MQAIQIILSCLLLTKFFSSSTSGVNRYRYIVHVPLSWTDSGKLSKINYDRTQNHKLTEKGLVVVQILKQQNTMLESELELEKEEESTVCKVCKFPLWLSAAMHSHGDLHSSLKTAP